MLALLRSLHAAANPTRWDHFWLVASSCKGSLQLHVEASAT